MQLTQKIEKLILKKKVQMLCIIKAFRIIPVRCIVDLQHNDQHLIEIYTIDIVEKKHMFHKLIFYYLALLKQDEENYDIHSKI